ncbi:hypothetical protein HBH98_071250 [Parastagonospora nodorum]|nr:hypothetical protein HBH53_020890 [Parastagonospora nodorum]KAH3968018.1 hypothetical protein HBH51_132730 [Parastagonospora nodorum]KAH3999975.1 hypothetical protein HBI10_106620 [Parastagonospora nodorum]KAH4009936.1 hypothetical protein HBI13_212020 [Parastagonospora nodorum]KAH4017849.1 hypothetical protein HBI09_195060 [Parastagonospora nodorum]
MSQSWSFNGNFGATDEYKRKRELEYNTSDAHASRLQHVYFRPAASVTAKFEGHASGSHALGGVAFGAQWNAPSQSFYDPSIHGVPRSFQHQYGHSLAPPPHLPFPAYAKRGDHAGGVSSLEYSRPNSSQGSYPPESWKKEHRNNVATPGSSRSTLSGEKHVPEAMFDLDKKRNRESAFRHPPIDFSRRQIRLVRVLQTEPDAPIRCKFALSLVHSKSVHYTALSYTWGGASHDSDLVKIILHKQDFWVRRNLWCFLRQVRDDPALRADWYWIDALCIDQAENGSSGNREKNHQVNMMGKIYSMAYLVITWLGEPPRQECAALDALQRFLEGAESEMHSGQIQKALKYLGDSTYWSRIWIIQEMVLAREVNFRVGPYEFDWNNIYAMRINSRLSNISHIQDLGWAMINILDLRHDRFHGRSLDLFTALNDFGIQECADPRDKIYGLLGLMDRKPFRADYSKPCVELFVDVVVIVWEFDNRPEFFPVYTTRGRKGEYHHVVLCAQSMMWGIRLGLTSSDFREAQALLLGGKHLILHFEHNHPNCLVSPFNAFPNLKT